MTRIPTPLRLTAGPEDEGLRLDRFLRKRSSVLSRTRARDLLDTGAVRVNGQRVKIASRPMARGDRVEVFGTGKEGPAIAGAGMPAFRIVHEDGAVLVVDKAPGILVQPTREGDRGTLINLLARHLRERHPEVRSPYLGLLHRIDRETSGLLLFSRRGTANRVLAEQFRTHSIEREYLALVRGVVTGEQGTIRDPLVRPDPHRPRRSSPAAGVGKSAVTHYRVRERFGEATLLAITLETGRTHQIRIHFAGRGHPVVGDRVYGRSLRFPAHPDLDRFPRQALHAARLGFLHPAGGGNLSFEAPLPDDFRLLLEALRRDAGPRRPAL